MKLSLPTDSAGAGFCVGLALTFASQGRYRAAAVTLLLAPAGAVLVGVVRKHRRRGCSETLQREKLARRADRAPSDTPSAYQDGSFSYSETGFSVTQGTTRSFSWADVQSIRAYKQDLFVVDRIVIEVEVGATTLYLDDDMPGHMKFMEKAAEHLAPFDSEWFWKVAFPAFAPNLTSVYER